MLHLPHYRLSADRSGVVAADRTRCRFWIEPYSVSFLVPPGLAFAAADMLGFGWNQITSWANGGTLTVGDGKPLDAWLYPGRRIRIPARTAIIRLSCCWRTAANFRGRTVPGEGLPAKWVTH